MKIQRFRAINSETAASSPGFPRRAIIYRWIHRVPLRCRYLAISAKTVPFPIEIPIVRMLRRFPSPTTNALFPRIVLEESADRVASAVKEKNGREKCEKRMGKKVGKNAAIVLSVGPRRPAVGGKEGLFKRGSRLITESRQTHRRFGVTQKNTSRNFVSPLCTRAIDTLLEAHDLRGSTRENYLRNGDSN